MTELKYRLYRKATVGNIISPQGYKGVKQYMTINEAIKANKTAKGVAFDPLNYSHVLLDFSDIQDICESCIEKTDECLYKQNFAQVYSCVNHSNQRRTND